MTPRRLAHLGPLLRLLVVSGSIAGCGGRDAEGSPTLMAELSPLTLSAPLVTIGADADEATTLDGVYGGLLLPGGELAIGNSGTGEVRVFGRDGRILRTSGRNGSGPGEFRSISWMGRMDGDSILVWDLPGNRFSVLDPEARFARSFALEGLFGPLQPEGVLEDGSVIATVSRMPDPRTHRGVVRDSVRVVVIADGGEMIDELVGLAGSEWLYFADGSSFRTVRLPLGRQTHVAVAGGSLIVYGASDGQGLQVMNSTEARDSLTLPLRQPQISTRTRATIVEQEFADPKHRRVLGRVDPDPSADPVFTDLVGDGEGRLWIRAFTDPESEHATWIVVSTRGGDMERIELPARARPLDVRGDRMLLRELGPDGEHLVTLREFHR